MVSEDASDPTVCQLEALFREHPAWIEAARHIAEGASSTVSFPHLPGRTWHLTRRGGRTELRPGAGPDPDLAFDLPSRAVARLAEVQGGVGDFAVELFSLMLHEDPALHVGLRVHAPFARLMRRGYVRLLLAAGPRVLAFGAAHGVRTLADLRALVRTLRARGRGGQS